ncbi:M20/M25/M40 family metallo-hydrolase [Arthrobacter sp. SIMBA_036]|uniref:M20/M25/M40 family metallo-hydrolase n=1 Tax=Arthrobacter sp. SIMBA_036 TaxID=3085778 RepID=UPI003979C08D
MEEATAGRIRRYVDSGLPAVLTELSALARIPAMAWAAFDPAELDRAAEAVAGLFRGTGFDDVRILRADRPDGSHGAPAVMARRQPAPGQTTVLLYAHYDVQPPGRLADWLSPPFDSVARDGRLFGRGVADNKGGIMLHVAAVRAVLHELGPDSGLGLIVLIDGEEEAGSPSLPELLDHELSLPHDQPLKPDVMIIADSGQWKVGTPALTTSLRGLILGTIEVRVLDHALHAGTYGGPLVDAITVLSRLIATLHDDDGNVAIAGLPGMEEPGPALSEAEFRRDSGVRPSVRLTGSGSLTSRLWTKPALAIIGIDAPSVAVSSDTLQPTAAAKFTLSLAPATDTAEAMDAVVRHLQRYAPFGAEVRVTPGGRTEGYAGDGASLAARSMAGAMYEAWGVDAVRMGVGGSIPAVSMLKERFPDAEVLVTGVEDPDSRAHGANESIHIGDFAKAIVAESLFLAGLALPVAD